MLQGHFEQQTDRLTSLQQQSLLSPLPELSSFWSRSRDIGSSPGLMKEEGLDGSGSVRGVGVRGRSGWGTHDSGDWDPGSFLNMGGEGSH